MPQVAAELVLKLPSPDALASRAIACMMHTDVLDCSACHGDCYTHLDHFQINAQHGLLLQIVYEHRSQQS